MRLLVQGRDALDGEHLVDQMRQERGLIASARPDLENALGSLELEQLEVLRMNQWLGDRLTITDRQWRVVVGSVTDTSWNEEVSRRHLDRAEHGEVANALRAELLDQPVPRPSELGLYSSFHHVCAPSSTVKCVRSRCSGVTET